MPGQFSNRINDGIFGCVSAGKSTLTNALFVELLSDCHMGRTTAVPQLYHELTTRETAIFHGEEKAGKFDLTASDISKIRETNRAKNKAAMDATLAGVKLDTITPVEYIVPKISGITKLVGDKLGNDVVMTIHDMPGLNDSKTKAVYFEYVRQHRTDFDLFIFVTDIASACNTSEEVEIVELISDCIKANHNDGIESELMVLVNKCDDLDVSGSVPMPVDEEQCDMVRQISKVLCSVFDPEFYSIACISAEDALIYRMVQAGRFAELDDKYISKFGANEFGRRKWKSMDKERQRAAVKEMLDDTDVCAEGLRMCGFEHMSTVLNSIFTPATQYRFLLNRYTAELNWHHLDHRRGNISDDLKWFREMDVRLCLLNEMFGEPHTTNENLYKDKLCDYMDTYSNYVVTKCDSETPPSSLLATNIRDMISGASVRFDKFWPTDTLITKLNSTMNAELLETVNYLHCNDFELVVNAYHNLVANEYVGIKKVAAETLNRVWEVLFWAMFDVTTAECLTFIQTIARICDIDDISEHLIHTVGMFGCQGYNDPTWETDETESTIRRSFLDSMSYFKVSPKSPWFYTIESMKHQMRTIEYKTIAECKNPKPLDPLVVAAITAMYEVDSENWYLAREQKLSESARGVDDVLDSL
jgi:hypothetical protein